MNYMLEYTIPSWDKTDALSMWKAINEIIKIAKKLDKDIAGELLFVDTYGYYRMWMLRSKLDEVNAFYDAAKWDFDRHVEDVHGGSWAPPE